MIANSEGMISLLNGLYEAAWDPEGWSVFLADLAGLTRSESVGLLFTDGDVHSAACSWQWDPELARLHSEYYHSIDIWWIRGAALPAGTIRTSQSLCPLSELKRTELYNDCLTRFRIEHGLFTMLENDGPRSASMSLFRGPSRPEFDQAEVDFLTILAPHLQRAFRIHSRLVNLDAQAKNMEAVVNAPGTPIFLLDANGKIVFMSGGATALLTERDGLRVSSSGLCAERSAESELLLDAIQRAGTSLVATQVATRDTVFISRRNRPVLQLFIPPIHDGLLRNSHRAAVIVFVSDPLRTPRPNTAVLHKRFGLTPAECRVALLLSDGHSSKEIANTVGVTGNTVRSQIKSIFSKTGVRRQRDLVRLLLSNVPPTIQAGA